VQSAINASATGDTVIVPAGSCSWSGFTLAKAITLQGAGVGKTGITLSQTATVTKQAGGATRITGFSFSVSGGGGGNAPRGFVINGSWQSAQPVIFQGNSFTVSGAGMFRVEVPGGVIFAQNTFNGGWDDSFLQLKDAQDSQQSWKTADTMGMRDKNGTLNIYIEDNTFVGGTNQGIDCDDACRMVNRYNTFTNSESNSHGKDTSLYGLRHFEIYNNRFYNTGAKSNDSAKIANENQAVWIRGGTGVIFNNYFDNLAGNYWGNKPEIRMNIRGAEDDRPQGTCAQVSYPVPHQLGQNNNGSSDFTDPIYLWGNTGTVGITVDWNWGNPCGLSFDNFFKWGRDGINNGSAKPGYTPYTYPHPLVGGSVALPPADTTAPTTPASLSAFPASSSQINLTWAASSDTVGVTGYRLERCQGSSCTGFTQIAIPTATSYSDSGLAANAAYRYRVRAADAAGNLSGYSPIGTATTQTVTLSQLPSGDTGIAAQYPGDINIQSNPAVIFADDFESYSSSSQLWNRWDNMYQQQYTRIATETDHVYRGGKSLEFRVPQQSTEVANAVIKNLNPTEDTVFVRVYTKFESGYSAIGSNHNGIALKAQYSTPGVPANGTNKFYVDVENSHETSPVEPTPGYTKVYVYHPEQRSQWGDLWYPNGTVLPNSSIPGDFGPNFVPRPNFLPELNRWYCYELMVKANTPGQRDGRVAVWIDGVLVADFQNLRLRDINSLKIDQVELGLQIKSNTIRQNLKWYDNVVVARSYIGPMVQSTSPSLLPPTNLLTTVR
jgi:hypothetical protein